jgi:hypothetical protein
VSPGPIDIHWQCPNPPYTSETNSFSSNTNTTGVVTVNIAAQTTYTIECDPGNIQDHIIVSVTNAQTSLVASPASVKSGNTSVLTYYATTVSSCTLTGPGVNLNLTPDASGNIGSPSSPLTPTTPGITAQSTYTLSCQTAVGRVNKAATIRLIPNVIEI